MTTATPEDTCTNPTTKPTLAICEPTRASSRMNPFIMVDSTQLVHQVFEAAQEDTADYLDRVLLQANILKCFNARLVMLRSMFSLIHTTNAIPTHQINDVMTEVISKTTTCVHDQLTELRGNHDDKDSTKLLLHICTNVDMINRFFRQQLEHLPPSLVAICKRHTTARHVYYGQRLFYVLGQRGFLSHVNTSPQEMLDEVVPETPPTNGPELDWPSVEDAVVAIKTIPGTPDIPSSPRETNKRKQPSDAEEGNMTSPPIQRQNTSVL